jgi:hypothetical protein
MMTRQQDFKPRRLIPVSLICHCMHARRVLFQKIKREDLIEDRHGRELRATLELREYNAR